MNIADSVVVITGASSGMGRELTFRYAERGCKLVIGARSMKEL
jgi:NADP-dependent 3-hydroxy acid dehydrogenase YdfG